MTKAVPCPRCKHSIVLHRWTYHRDPHRPATSKCDKCVCTWPAAESLS